MKKIITLVCVLLTNEAVYSSMGACESAMSTFVQKVRDFQTERRFKYVKRNEWVSARVLMRMLRNNPKLSVQIRIAKAAAAARPRRSIEVLKELSKQEDPSLELQEAIVSSMVKLLKIARNWATGEREQAIQFLEEWLENKELHSKRLQNTFITAAEIIRGKKGFEFLEKISDKYELHSKKLQDTFIDAAVTIGGNKGFDLLKKISDKYPALEVERQFAIIAFYTGGSKGVDMLTKRITDRTLSLEEQRTYAYYAGRMGSHGFSILDLLEQKSPSSIKHLQFAFLSGQHKSGAKHGRSSSSSSYGDGGASSTAAGVIVGF